MKHKNTSTQPNKILSYFNSRNKVCFEYKEALKVLPNYSMLKNGAKGIDKITNLSEKLESAFSEDPNKSNIHYFTKINRVAKLKRNI